MKDRIDELGQRAWMDFYDEKKRLYGDDSQRKQYLTSDVHRHHKFYKAFREIATICLTRGYDVTDYVFTCFTLVTHDHRYVTPRDFAHKDMADKYAANKKAYGDTCSASWEAQSTDLKSMAARLVPSQFESDTDILKDNRMAFTSWFRVFYPKVPDAELIRIYGAMAWADLQVDKRLRLLLRQLRPDTMEVLESLHGYFMDIIAGAEVTHG